MDFLYYRLYIENINQYCSLYELLVVLSIILPLLLLFLDIVTYILLEIPTQIR